MFYGTPFTEFWYKLSTSALQVLTAQGKRALYWTYNWLYGRGGYFIKRDGTVKRLPPGMRLAAAISFPI